MDLSAVFVAPYLLALFAQDPAPADDPPPPPPLPVPGVPADPWADVPRGVVPEGTDAPARALFESLRGALAPTEEGRARATSFRFPIEARTHTEEHHKLDGTLSFLSPTFVRFTSRSGYGTGLGPEGYWRLDGEVCTPLDTKEDELDRHAVEDMIELSENFLQLLDPARWRVVRATAPDRPVAPPPTYKHLEYDPEQLAWLAIDTPDFGIHHEDPGAPEPQGRPLYRVTLGVERQGGLPRFATVQELRDGVPQLQGSITVSLGSWAALDGYRLPTYTTVHRFLGVDDAAQAVFEDRPSWEMSVLPGGSLAPGLAPMHFLCD